MCVIFFAYKVHSKYDLILAANRDEFFDRPAGKASFWSDAPDILAGRDLKEGGTWLGVTKTGRLAGLTNFRNPKKRKKSASSRGEILKNFLENQTKSQPFMDQLTKKIEQYNDFNLLLKEQEEFYYYSSLRGKGEKLNPGIYGLSNHFIDTPWPKVVSGKEKLSQIISMATSKNLPESLFFLLKDKSDPIEKDLPQTGLTLEWEKILAPIFVANPVYGTRASTIILFDKQKRISFWEKTFNEKQEEVEKVNFKFKFS